MDLRGILKFLFGVSNEFSPNKVIEETGVTIFQQSMFLISHLIVLILRSDQEFKDSHIRNAVTVQKLFSENVLSMNVDLDDEEITKIIVDMNVSIEGMNLIEREFHETETIIDTSRGLPDRVKEGIINYLFVFCLTNSNRPNVQIDKLKDLSRFVFSEEVLNFKEIRRNAEDIIRSFNLKKMQ